MSIKIMSAVWELELPHSKLLVLLALADHAKDDGSDVFPSIGHTAWKVGYSDRQVTRIIAELVKDGLLVKVKEANRHRPTEYAINIRAGILKPAYSIRGDILTPLQNDVRGDRFQPKLMLVGASCTAELLQDDPGGLARAVGLPIPVIALELPAYQKKENWGAAETFYRIVRTLVRPAPADEATAAGLRKRCNLLGPTALGFRHRDDVREITGLLGELGIDVNVVAPLGASPADIARLGDASFNVVLYPEIAGPAALWLERTLKQPAIRTTPIGDRATRRFIEEVAALAGVDPSSALAADRSRAPWYARSVDSTYLTGKRVFIFGDATHAIAAARVAAHELGFKVVGLGTYSREYAREVRQAAAEFGLEALISEDYLEVEEKVVELQPELVLGTQMERHVAKRLGIPCAVISAPVHVQDFPARHSPQMGFEGANVVFDSWVHPLMMGLEEHLLTMFRGDFEFHDGATPSHLGPGHTAEAHPAPVPQFTPPQPATTSLTVVWSADAEKELGKVPFFVRGKARRNTERFAGERGLATITLETLYDAKAHFGR